jgi:fibronectin-binding autotransporter adhesin
MPGSTATVRGLTISGGDGGQEGGGGILNDHAILTMHGCAVQNCAAPSNNGGGIYNDGSGGSAALTILDSSVGSNYSFNGNYAYSAGGGLYNDAENGGSATVTIINSILSHNHTISEGGGIYNHSGTMTITSSSVSDNQAGVNDPFPSGYGGGISN